MPTLTRTSHLSSALRISVARLARRLRSERLDLSLSLNQLAVLATLDRHGPMSPSELAGHEKVQPPSMTRILGALEQRGLVTRVPHPTDGRQQVVSLTADARAMIREDRRRRDEWLTARLAELTADERDVLRRAAPIIERLAGA